MGPKCKGSQADFQRFADARSLKQIARGLSCAMDFPKDSHDRKKPSPEMHRGEGN
jgi:hypothetical protein